MQGYSIQYTSLKYRTREGLSSTVQIYRLHIKLAVWERIQKYGQNFDTLTLYIAAIDLLLYPSDKTRFSPQSWSENDSHDWKVLHESWKFFLSNVIMGLKVQECCFLKRPCKESKEWSFDENMLKIESRSNEKASDRCIYINTYNFISPLMNHICIKLPLQCDRKVVSRDLYKSSQ